MAITDRPMPNQILPATPAHVQLPGMQRRRWRCCASSPAARGAEYWTMRCTRCGGIHLDIVKAAPARADNVRCV